MAKPAKKRPMFDREKFKKQLIEKDYKLPKKVYDDLPEDARNAINGLVDRLTEAAEKVFYAEQKLDAFNVFTDKLMELSSDGDDLASKNFAEKDD